MFAAVKKNAQSSQAGALVSEFLNRTYFIGGFTESVRKTYWSIQHIQQGFRNHSLSIRTRMKVTETRIWTYFQEMLVHGFIRLRGPNKTQYTEDLVKRLNNINLEVKKRVLALYLARRALQHTIRFLLWVLARRPKKYNTQQVSCWG